MGHWPRLFSNLVLVLHLRTYSTISLCLSAMACYEMIDTPGSNPIDIHGLIEFCTVLVVTTTKKKTCDDIRKMEIRTAACALLD